MRKELERFINIDFPDFTIPKTTIQNASQRGYSMDARIVMGKYWTPREYEERRKRVLNTPLP